MGTGAGDTDRRRLLILACSARKAGDAAPLPAVARYDGPLFRTLRKYIREDPPGAAALDTWVLSAEFGLISADQPIPPYDTRLSPERARALRPVVLARLAGIFAEPYADIHVSLGRVYHEAADGWRELVPARARVSVGSGPIGARASQLAGWLRDGRPTTLPARADPAAACDTDVALGMLRDALHDEQGRPDRYSTWFVEVDGRRVAAKWAAAILSSRPVGTFTSQTALRLLAARGIAVRHT